MKAPIEHPDFDILLDEAESLGFTVAPSLAGFDFLLTRGDLVISAETPMLDVYESVTCHVVSGDLDETTRRALGFPPSDIDWIA